MLRPTKRVKRPSALSAVVGLLVVLASCGSHTVASDTGSTPTVSSTSADDTEVVVRDGQFFISVDGRTAIIGGGGDVDSDGELDRSSAVWLVDTDTFDVSQLHDLPTGEILAGVSGAVIGDTVVASAQVCHDWVESAEFFQCFGQREPVVWTAPLDGGPWQDFSLPDELLDGGGFPGASGRDVRAVGVRGAEYLFTWFGSRTNRVVAFDTATNEFALVVDLDSFTTDNSSYPPACVTSDGELLVLERDDESFDINAAASYVVSQVGPDTTKAERVRFQVPPLTAAVWLFECRTADDFSVALSGQSSQVREFVGDAEPTHDLGPVTIGSNVGGPYVWLSSPNADERVVEVDGAEKLVDHGPLSVPWGSEYIAQDDGILIAVTGEGIVRHTF